MLLRSERDRCWPRVRDRGAPRGLRSGVVGTTPLYDATLSSVEAISGMGPGARAASDRHRSVQPTTAQTGRLVRRKDG